MWRKIKWVTVMSAIILGLTACHPKTDKDTIRVGTISGPETELMEVAKDVALKRYGLKVEIVTFSDYNTPNEALSDGSLDANMFQHMPYLTAQIQARGYKLVPIGKTFIYPMGIYSKKITQLSQLVDNAKVGIPNDPSNEARALLLLQQAKLIQLKSNVSFNATPTDIANNPKHLQIVQLDAAQLPRALNDVTIAVINTNYAIPAGLSPTKNALVLESSKSPYANLIVARMDNQQDPRLKQLIAAFQSPEVLAAAKKLFGDGAIPAWK